jgi:hypothetical protein
MDEYGRFVYPDLIFQFLVYQCWLDRNGVWYYCDGSLSRRLMNLDSFMQMIKDKYPSLVHDVYQSTRDTSFHLLNTVDMTVTHLTPHTEADAPYLDSIQNLVDSKKTKKPIKRMITEKKPLTEILQQYGFNTPTKNSVENLTVSLEKQDTDRQGFISRFLNRRGGR